jgi:hypothetical protein
MKSGGMFAFFHFFIPLAGTEASPVGWCVNLMANVKTISSTDYLFLGGEHKKFVREIFPRE